jgi:hypothetical protein
LSSPRIQRMRSLCSYGYGSLSLNFANQFMCCRAVCNLPPKLVGRIVLEKLTSDRANRENRFPVSQ